MIKFNEMKILPCFLYSQSVSADLEEDDEDLFLEAETPSYAPEADLAGQKRGLQSTGTGQQVLAFVLLILGIAFVLPIFGIYLLKSPPPLQHVYILGVSYYKLLFIFNLCAVMLVVTTTVFLRATLPVIAVLFATSLFCSIPLVVGLRHGMTMQQAILNISVFADWPFFLRPMYLLTFLLLPAGGALFSFLQLRAIFSREKHSYVFSCAVLFFGLAIFLGVHELTRAGQPTVLAMLLRQSVVEVTAGSEDLANSKLHSDQDREGKRAAPSNNTAVGAESLADEVRNRQANPVHDSPVPTMPAGETFAVTEHKIETMLLALDGKLTDLALVQANTEEKRHAELAALNTRVEALASQVDAVLTELQHKGQNHSVAQAKPATMVTEQSGNVASELTPENNKELANLNMQIDKLIEKVHTIQDVTNKYTQ